MRILVVNSGEPFVRSVTDQAAGTLAQALASHGHESEVLRIPFSSAPSNAIPVQAVMIRLFELSNVDRVVALDFPSYLIRHPAKIIWLIDRPPVMRTLWEDLPNEPLSGLDAANWRDVINNADRTAFNEARRILVPSDRVRRRLEQFNGAVATVLSVPASTPTSGDVADASVRPVASWRPIVEAVAG